MKKSSKILLLVVVVFTAAAISSSCALNEDYYRRATPVGTLEKKYTPHGPYEVSFAELDAENKTYKKYEIWYPSERNDAQKPTRSS